MSRPRDLRTTRGFVAAMILLAGIAIVTYRSARQTLADDRQVTFTHEVLESLQATLGAIVDAETIARGYVITGQASFLDPYEDTLAGLSLRLQSLRGLTLDSPLQQERLATLEPLIQQKVAFLEEQLAARRERGAAAGQAMVSSGTGKALMDAIRRTVAAMEADERSRLDERIARNGRSQQVTMTVIVIGNLLAWLMLVGAIRVVYRENACRRRAEQAALVERNRLDLILTSLGEGVVSAEADGTISLVNPAAAGLLSIDLGDTEDAWRGRVDARRADGVSPYPPDEMPLARAVRGERFENVELFLRHPARPEGHFVSVTGSPLRDDEGTVRGGVVVLRDISERRRHEREMVRAHDELTHAYAELDRTRLQQLQTKDQLLSHVSHELRTPLTAAHQFVEILSDGVAGALTAEQREYADIALRNLRQLRAMIGDLLEATRLESAKLTVAPARMQLAEVVHEVYRTLYSPAAEKGITLHNGVGVLPDVFADANRVRQILTNLIHNAVKFTDAGDVRLDATVMDGDPAFVRLTVSDTGCGIPADALERVFTRLYQAGEQRPESRQGLGLGLFICRELVTRQGGRIWVESEAGRGSTFHCTFPVYSDANVGRVGHSDAIQEERCA